MTRRLLLSYLSVTVFVLAILEVPFAIFFADRERETLVADVQRDAMVLATLYEDALDQGTPYSPQPAIDYASTTGARVVLVNAEGISLIDTGGVTYRDFSSRGEVAAALAGSIESGTRYSTTLETDLLYVAVPVASGGTVHGAVRLTFATADVEARIHRFWWGLGLVGLVVMAAIAGIGWVIARSVGRPVRELQQAAARVSAGDLEVRVDAGDAPAEVQDLAGTFNDMADRLRRLIDQQRQFVADTSHQLRTPLTALRLRLETLEETAATGERAEVEAAIDEIRRLSDLVDQLLAMARTDRDRRPPAEIDLVAVARERGDTWSAVAEDQKVVLSVSTPDMPLWVSAQTGAVEQILDNYLANALAVSSAGDAVSISVEATGDAVELHVVDQGPGLSAEGRRRAFERYWRGDRSRPGTGLGLAIVDQLALAVGAEARLEPAGGGGIDAVVRFPVPEAGPGEPGRTIEPPVTRVPH